MIWKMLVPPKKDRDYGDDASGKNHILSDLQDDFTCELLKETCLDPFLPMLKEMGAKIKYNYGRARFYMVKGPLSWLKPEDEDDLVGFFISVFQKAYDGACHAAPLQEQNPIGATGSKRKEVGA